MLLHSAKGKPGSVKSAASPRRRKVSRVPTCGNSRHPSPLHFLMAELREKHIHPLRLEKIAAVRQHSKWMTNIKISIPDTKEEAAKEVEDDRTEVVVYSDGSGLDGQVRGCGGTFP